MIYAGKNAYPFAYLRTAGDEKILVVLNPPAQESDFPCALRPSAVLYETGGAAAFDGKTVRVPPCAAGFYLL